MNQYINDLIIMKQWFMLVHYYHIRNLNDKQLERKRHIGNEIVAIVFQ
jgi:hypothetical protein